jgi:hypothetical protein
MQARSSTRLVHQRGQGDPPAAVDHAEAVVVRHPHAGQEDLVEVAAPAHLAQRPDVHPGRAHVDEERGDALVLRRVRIGPAQRHADLAVLRHRRPDLLPLTTGTPEPPIWREA